MMDNPEYSTKTIQKIKTYRNNDILIRKNLIVTFETKNKILETDEIVEIIENYLKQ